MRKIRFSLDPEMLFTGNVIIKMPINPTGSKIQSLLLTVF